MGSLRIIALIKEGASLERAVLGEPDAADESHRMTWPELVKAAAGD